MGKELHHLAETNYMAMREKSVDVVRVSKSTCVSR